MTIQFTCEQCSRELTTSDDRAGAKAKCPDCGNEIVVPYPNGGAENAGGFGAPVDTRDCPMCGSAINPYAKACEFCGEDLESRASSKRNASQTLASVWTRLGARLLDGVFSFAIMIPIMLVTGYVQRAMDQRVASEEVIIYSTGGFLLNLVLHGYLLATRGQTIGKLICQIKIVDYRTGELPGFARAYLAREFVIGLISMIPCIGGIVALVNVLMIFNAEQRCLHDNIAGTKVVDVD